jgi:hypothetical protein
MTGETLQGIENSYLVYTPGTDTSSWNPKVVRFLNYWLSLKPTDGLPGRQHFDPLDIPDLMPRVWMLDVLREPLRFRYRFAGTKEVETLQREVTGKMFEQVHSQCYHKISGRLFEIVRRGVASYRKGNVIALHKKEHMMLENCIAPMARDGSIVDLLIGFTVVYQIDGREG